MLTRLGFEVFRMNIRLICTSGDICDMLYLYFDFYYDYCLRAFILFFNYLYVLLILNFKLTVVSSNLFLTVVRCFLKLNQNAKFK